MKTKQVLAGVVVLVLLVGVGLALKFLPRGKKVLPGADVLVQLRPKPGDPESVVDPMYGRTLFEQNCVTCHGWRGEGDGPCDNFLWKRPRNLADGSYMNSRTDEQLIEVMGKGGRDSTSQLSRIMPSWSTTFNAHQQEDLVAWVRRLHPNIADFVNAGDYTRHESVLSAARADLVKSKSGTDLAPGDATTTIYAVWSDSKGRPRRVNEPAPAPSTAGLAGYVAFTRVEIVPGKIVSLGLAIGPEKKIHKTAVFEKVTILAGASRDESSVDSFVKAFEGKGEDVSGVNPPGIPGHDEITKALGGAVKRLYWRLVLAIEQDKEDWDDIAAGRVPNASHPGHEIYDRMKCWQCHGPTGRAKGPGVAEREPTPGNFSDGFRMGQFTDQYLLDLLENGGPAMNISGVMPSYSGQMTKDEMLELVKYLRSLSTSK